MQRIYVRKWRQDDENYGEIIAAEAGEVIKPHNAVVEHNALVKYVEHLEKELHQSFVGIKDLEAKIEAVQEALNND